MVGLKSLASELLHEITWLACYSPLPSRNITSYEAKALGVMRSVCRLTNAIAEPILFRHLVIRVNFADLKSPGHPQLRDLAQGKTTACTHAKALNLCTYGEEFDEAGRAGIGIGELALALGTLCNVNSVT